MTISYQLAPVPKWYIADLVGKPLGGGYLATFSSLDNTQLNPVYEDPAGAFVWPYVTIPNVGKLGILFDENGSQGPFYFAFDSSNPSLLYYLEVYDSNGNLQWTINNFSPPSGSGGSIITTAVNIDNLVPNNVMWRNLGAAGASGAVSLLLAPGAHSAFANNASNSAGLYTGSDIYFLKNNTSATDAITFPKFTLGSQVLTGDVTPVDYCNYACTGAGSSETVKCVQFPITHGVQNLEDTAVTITIWAKSASSSSIVLNWLQFFGDGAGASSPVITPIQTLALSTSWTKYTITPSTSTIPDVTGKVLGACGNDALFLQVQFPFDATCNIDFTKPCSYLGNIAPASQYENYDSIDALINSARTGDIRNGYATSSYPGWLLMNDGSIGSSSSGATLRANTDTFPLYNLLWNNVIDTYAPVSTGRGASAVADFTANKTLTLMRVLGRVLGGAGAGSGLTPRVLGEYLGEENHTLTRTELPTILTDTADTRIFNLGTDFGGLVPSNTPGSGSIVNSDGGNGHNTMQPTSFMNFFIKL